MNSSDTPEIEAKILETSPERLSKELERIRARKIFDGILRAQWLENVNGERLRVRQEGQIIMVEHKLMANSGTDGIKSWKEKGFEAKKFQDVVDTLLAVGFVRVWLPSVKRRVSYIIGNEDDGVKLDFDTYLELMGKYGTQDKPVIPTLLEIESKKSIEEVKGTAFLLWFHESHLKDWGPVKLFQHYYPNEEIK